MRQKTIRVVVGGLSVLVLTGGLIAQTAPAAKRPAPSQPSSQPLTPAPAKAPAAALQKPSIAVAHAPDAPAADAAALVKQYCATCHSEKGKAGGLSLAS